MKKNFYDKLIAHLNTYNFKYVNYYASNTKIIIVVKQNYKQTVTNYINNNKPKNFKTKIQIVDM